MKALRWYYHLYYFLAANRIKNNDLDPRHMHTLTVTVIFTGLLMWSYAVVAWMYFSSPVPGIVGVACSLVHLFSPLLFRVTNRYFVVCNIMLGAGITHQATFAFYSGGFASNILIWFSVLPMLGGVIAGRRGAISWGIVSVLVTAGFLVAYKQGLVFPDHISPEGRFFSTVLIHYGFIMITTVVTYIYVSLQQNTEALLIERQQKIDDLFKVLFHDLANPLGRLGIGLSIIKKNSLEPPVARGVEIISQAGDSMLEITQNVRKMYALSKGKGDVSLSSVSLNECVQYIQQLFGHELNRKQLQLAYDFEAHRGLAVHVEPISFKNQVLGNIISNAIKFSSPGGRIAINASCLKHPHYAIEIADEGVGIPDELIPQLFQVDRKVHRMGTDGEKGTGFGLQIMKSFVEMYGGDVSIRSTVRSENRSGGTTFTITLTGHR